MPARRSRIVAAEIRDDLADSLASLRRSLGLADGFAPAVLAEAERAADSVTVAPDDDLADLREIAFLTIDPPGSTDLDQALHLERTATGGVLHYAIADVPAYVAPGSALDAEALVRGQTMYAPDGRVPLHPAVISEGAASLLPEQDRRAYVWRFDLDEDARVRATSVTRAIVRSRTQWSYDDAQRAIERGSAPPTLLAMPWFGAAREAREAERGGASLNLPETRIVATAEGYRLERSEGVPLEDWNAHVSLMTGMAAAEIMLAGGVGILRTMPPADADDIAEFRAQTIALGLPWRHDVTYGDYLRTLPRTPAARAVKEYAAGLFRGAGYVVVDGDRPAQTVQAAIGAPYAHTTAPLRRLVDRWVLVICDALSNGRAVPAWARDSLAQLPTAMNRSAQRASQLNAGALDRVEAAVLHGREGEEFDALVLSVRGDGARVQVPRPPVAAKVKGLDAEPGTRVRLRLDAASVNDGRLVFTPVSATSSAGAAGPAPAG